MNIDINLIKQLEFQQNSLSKRQSETIPQSQKNVTGNSKWGYQDKLKEFFQDSSFESAVQNGENNELKNYLDKIKKTEEMQRNKKTDKKKEKLEQNKKAAKKSRERKKIYIAALETKVAVLEKENENLQQELFKLKDSYAFAIRSMEDILWEPFYQNTFQLSKETLEIYVPELRKTLTKAVNTFHQEIGNYIEKMVEEVVFPLTPLHSKLIIDILNYNIDAWMSPTWEYSQLLLSLKLSFDQIQKLFAIKEKLQAEKCMLEHMKYKLAQEMQNINYQALRINELMIETSEILTRNQFIVMITFIKDHQFQLRKKMVSNFIDQSSFNQTKKEILNLLSIFPQKKLEIFEKQPD